MAVKPKGAKMKKKILALLLCVISLVCVIAFASCSPTGGGEVYTGSGEEFTVTFNPAGGTLSGDTEITVRDGDKVPEPTVEREGYILTGWYSGKSKDTKWNFEKNTVSKNITLTAWWTKNTSGGGVCEHEYQLDASKPNAEPDCLNSGKHYYICIKCTAEDYEILTKLGHDLDTEVIEPTCGVQGYTREFCKRDGCTHERKLNIVNATGNHEWGDYQTIVDATKYTDGKENRTCKVCQATQEFPIPAFYKPIDFKDLDIGNYLYTGGSYVNEPFVNISKYAGVYASNYYSVCEPSRAVDGDVTTYWSADTLVDGATYTGHYFQISFSSEYDIGAFNVVLPFYSSWGLGDECYVSYDVEALINGEWVKVGEFSDKTAQQSGVDGVVLCELSTPVKTNDIRFVVTHSTRYNQAMLYEVEVLAKAPATERIPYSLIGSTVVSASGVYNSWGNTPSSAIDGSNGSYWFTDTRHAYVNGVQQREVFITLDFSVDKFLAAVQLTVTANAGSKSYTIHYWDSTTEEWVAHKTFTVERDKCTEGGQYSNASGAGKVCTFLAELNVVTSKIKITEHDVNAAALSNADYKVCEILPLTIIQQAVPTQMGTYKGCIHNYKLVDLNGDNKRNEKDVVLATCTAPGYAIMECTKCKIRTYTDATDVIAHKWSDFTIETEATATTLGVKKATCADCGATRTKNYSASFEEIQITDFFHNAPAAWAHTFDDGNYLETYEWVIPRLQEYHFRATIEMSITYVTQYVDLWNEHFKTGTFDLGSHSYNHAGIYGASTNEQSFLTDVNRAHYWFMSNFNGQRILTFATPNGATSKSNSEFVTGLMASCRNGGTQVMYNIMSNLTERQYWGNINSYISKADQTEGVYAFVGSNANGSYEYVVTYKLDPETGEPTSDIEKSEYVWRETGSYTKDGNSYVFQADNKGDYRLVRNPGGTYKYIAKDTLTSNYVFDEETNRLVDQPEISGTYYYNAETYVYEWRETGSYDLNASTGEYTWRNDDGGAFKLKHTELGSYEKGINQLLSVEGGGAWTVDCLHSLGSGSIYSTYASTMSKFEYLKKTGIWACSYTDVVMYGKETQNATLNLISQTETEIKLELTDTLDDFMFNHALTIKVDIPDEWTSVVAMQGDKAIELVTNAEYKDNMTKVGCTIIDGYLYIDVLPDQGIVTITGITE